MVHIVVASVVRGKVLKWVPWQGIAAVVIDCLDGGASEKPHSLARSKPRDEIPYASSERVEQEAFEGMIVKGTVCIRDI